MHYEFCKAATAHKYECATMAAPNAARHREAPCERPFLNAVPDRTTLCAELHAAGARLHLPQHPGTPNNNSNHAFGVAQHFEPHCCFCGESGGCWGPAPANRTSERLLFFHLASTDSPNVKSLQTTANSTSTATVTMHAKSTKTPGWACSAGRHRHVPGRIRFQTQPVLNT
jgi:hypothetical protein